jgi:hypothetical protein
MASASAQSPVQDSGVIRSDDGGAPGYQHSIERSRFSAGPQQSDLRRVEEHGFSKMVGPEGVFAIDSRNGLALAIRSGGANKDEARSEEAEAEKPTLLDPDKHNERVVDYFVSAGIPRDQVGAVHANTYLSASGSMNDNRPPAVKVDGYASVLERWVENFAVPDSVAWARIDEQGTVVAEWVYWPAIPAKVLVDARRLEERLASNKSEFLARLPPDLPPGQVVIRHSSATEDGPFEAYASYDVVDRKESTIPARDKNQGGAQVISVTVRHFDADGAEIRLPQERRNAGADFPPKPQRE